MISLKQEQKRDFEPKQKSKLKNLLKKCKKAIGFNKSFGKFIFAKQKKILIKAAASIKAGYLVGKISSKSR